MSNRPAVLLACLVALGADGRPAFAMNLSLTHGTLWQDDRPVLETVPDTFAAVPDSSGVGVFLRMSAPRPGSFVQSPLGTIRGLRRFTSCHRYEPFWMKPAAGATTAEVPVEVMGDLKPLPLPLPLFLSSRTPPLRVVAPP